MKRIDILQNKSLGTPVYSFIKYVFIQPSWISDRLSLPKLMRLKQNINKYIIKYTLCKCTAYRCIPIEKVPFE